jgi:hypothetical protein
MGETIPGGNINQTAGDWHWRQRPGWGAPNPVGQDAPTQSTVNSAPILSNVSNPGVGVTPPNAGKPISVSGGSGSTANPSVDTGRKVTGQVSGTSVVVNLPG